MTDADTTQDQPLQLDGAFAIVTEEREQLHSLCVRALAELLGCEPDVDEDGDIAIPVHGFAVYVTIADDGPQIHVWSSLVTELADRAQAEAALTDLATEWPRLRFAFSDNHLLVSTILDADPFAPQHLLNLIDEIHELTHDLDDDLAERFGGTLDCDADDDSYAGGCGGCGDDCNCGDSHDGGCGDDCACGEAQDDKGDSLPLV
ncbi:T3SS (YopN, CesT) and YbjN peptide-binding chaperone 1 [Rhodococcus kronopolitis]|uniref:TY-Chap central domain-containing protein n=1 Tax=Rhodococcus kronopolitis TaxID=1460226 RepID=A0ABV9FYN2_9NOCA